MMKLLEWFGCPLNKDRSCVSDSLRGYEYTDVSKISSRKYIGGVELVKNRKIIPEKKKKKETIW